VIKPHRQEATNQVMCFQNPTLAFQIQGGVKHTKWMVGEEGNNISAAARKNYKKTGGSWRNVPRGARREGRRGAGRSKVLYGNDTGKYKKIVGKAGIPIGRSNSNCQSQRWEAVSGTVRDARGENFSREMGSELLRTAEGGVIFDHKGESGREAFLEVAMISQGLFRKGKRSGFELSCC